MAAWDERRGAGDLEGACCRSVNLSAEIDHEAIDQEDPLFDEKFEKRFEAFLGEILKESRTEQERR